MEFKLSILLIILSLGEEAWARFDPSDADRIEPEEKNNTETWNDKNSYRYPLYWDREWSKSEMGYRINAGSLNVSRFNFDDDVKIAPNPFSRFTASFVQSRREDLVDRSIEREVKIGWFFMEGMRLSLLGDVNTLKEFGDLGLALAFDESSESRTEIYAWSVDHYYVSKRSDDSATRDRESQTYGIRSRKSILGDRVRWDGRFEWDSPIHWSLPTSGWTFQYEKKIFTGRLELSTADDLLYYASTSWEEKFERKSRVVNRQTENIFKSMQRETLISEVGFEQKNTEHDEYTAALQRVWRRVSYDDSGPNLPQNLPGETLSPHAVHRIEWGLILTKYSTLASWYGLQQGAMLNDAFIQEDNRIWKKLEIKYQLLFDFRLNERSKFALNTTWDVDQIVRDYPYSKAKPFRPWGGGDLQFMMKI